MKRKNTDFKSDTLREEFAATKQMEIKPYHIIAIILVVVCVASGVFYIVKNRAKKLDVDWLSYGKALSNIKKDYPDYDKIIILI